MSTETRFTDQEVIDALAAVVEEAGSAYKYTRSKFFPNCFYAPDEKNPYGCIVGATLRKLGLEGDMPEATGVADLKLAHDGVITYMAEYMLHKAQKRQDNGSTWGAALEAALAAKDGYKL